MGAGCRHLCRRSVCAQYTSHTDNSVDRQTDQLLMGDRMAGCYPCVSSVGPWLGLFAASLFSDCSPPSLPLSVCLSVCLYLSTWLAACRCVCGR